MNLANSREHHDPTSVATLSRECKKVILAALEKTGDPSLIDFKLHDFGFRGVSSVESAALGGAAHLVNFKGTDTMAALELASEFYGEIMPGFSIPATEHSTITSWGRERECDAYANFLDQYPQGLIACVSDSYDIYQACDVYWGKVLREKVLARDGVLVIRPDSGDPHQLLPHILEILGDRFGWAYNDKGYKVLDRHVRVIQGDGVNLQSIGTILATLETHRWSADNLAFGMGGALLQKLNRDTLKFAFKCCSVVVDGERRDVYKQPIDEPFKQSKAGLLKLVQGIDGYQTVAQDAPGKDVLQTVFLNGYAIRRTTLSEVRERARIGG